jgi:predicted PurR-regulated permease PerM
MERRTTSSVPRWLDLVAAWSWRLVIIAIAIALVAYVVIELRLVVIPLIVAVFLAALLMPLVDRLERRTPLPRTIATVLVIIGALAALAGVIWLLVPGFVDQVDELRGAVTQGIRDIEVWLDDTFGLTLGEAAERVTGGIDSGALSDRVVSGAVLVGEVLAGLLLAIVLCFFVVRDGPRFSAAVGRWLPSDRRELGAAIGRRSWRVIGGYLRGVMITGVVDAVVIGVGLWLIGVPLVFSLMVLTFFGAFFPLVGAFVAGAVAVLVALVANGVPDALITLALVIAVQQLEGDVVAPLVIGRTLSLHPVVIVLALTAGAIVAGIVGAAFAVPLAAVIRGAIDEIRTLAAPGKPVPVAANGSAGESASP